MDSRLIKCSMVLWCMVAAVATVCAAEEKMTPALEKGIGQYKHENFEEALKSLIAARQESPD